MYESCSNDFWGQISTGWRGFNSAECSATSRHKGKLYDGHLLTTPCLCCHGCVLFLESDESMLVECHSGSLLLVEEKRVRITIILESLAHLAMQLKT